MNAKQKKFCQVYAITSNAVRSYMEAYEASYESACANAYRMMEKDGIKEKIRELQELNKSETVLIVNHLKKRLKKTLFRELDDLDLILDIVRKRLNNADKLSTKQLLDLSRVRGLELGNLCRLVEGISSLEGLDVIEDSLIELLQKTEQEMSGN